MDIFKIKSTGDKVAKKFSFLEREQLPFALAWAATRVAQVVLKNEKAVAAVRLDRPTRFTMQSTFLIPASKNDKNPGAIVGWKGKSEAPKGNPAGEYLKPNVNSGVRPKKGFEKLLIGRGIMRSDEYAVPGNGARLDAYGNISRGQLNQVLSRLGAFRESGSNANATQSKRSQRNQRKSGANLYFVAEIDGQRGIWQRVNSGFGKGQRLILAFVSHAPRYRARFPFYKVAENTVRANYEKEFTSALASAVATAK